MLFQLFENLHTIKIDSNEIMKKIRDNFQTVYINMRIAICLKYRHIPFVSIL